jgi:hypothetical protein
MQVESVDDVNYANIRAVLDRIDSSRFRRSA